MANNGTEAHMEEEDALAVGYEVSCGLDVGELVMRWVVLLPNSLGG